VETAGLAEKSFAREKFSECAGLAESVSSLQFIRFSLSNAVAMLRRIYGCRPPDMELDAYLGAKYDKILSQTQQAATFFAEEAMIAYGHSFGPLKATFVSYMKTVVHHLDPSNDHPPLTDELAEMPRELAQLVVPALITVFALLSDASQAESVGTFECVSSATIGTRSLMLWRQLMLLTPRTHKHRSKTFRNCQKRQHLRIPTCNPHATARWWLLEGSLCC
jgi:hypothetical protein